MPKLLIRAALCFALGFALAAAAVADGTGETEAAGPVAIGAVVPDFTVTDTDGKTLQLTKRSLDRKAVEAAVRKAAEAAGATAGCPLSTKWEGLKAFQDDDDEFDVDLKVEALAVMGGAFGRMASEENTAEVKTLADAVAWVMQVDNAPIVFFCWSPRCPTSRHLNDDILARVATVDARLYAIACNYKDTDEDFAKYHEMLDFPVRIFVDREQKLTDVLGGKRTPHFFVIDSENKLRFRGSLDNNWTGTKEDAEVENWLTDAITAVRTGKDVPKTETPGPG